MCGFDPNRTLSGSPAPSIAALGRLHRTRAQRWKRQPGAGDSPYLPPLGRLLLVLPRFRFLPDSDPNFLGRAGTFLVGCQCQALRGTFWRFGTPIGRAGPSEAGLLFCRAETGVSLEPLRSSHVPGAGGWSIPAASAWATPADSDSASEAFASAFPSCPRPVRLPPRALRPRLVPSPAELGSWGEGPRLLQGFRFRPFPTRFPIPRHPEPRPNPGGTGQPARGPGSRSSP